MDLSSYLIVLSESYVKVLNEVPPMMTDEKK